MDSTITDAPGAPAERYVFVYGTLRQGEQRDINHLSPAPVLIGPCKTYGTLYNLGCYPGVRLGGQGWVQGEAYRITPALERQLDAIEEVWPQQTGEYAKREVAMQCAGLTITCLVYEASEERVRGCSVMVSGDWVKRPLLADES